MTQKTLEKVIGILKTQYRHHRVPSVTEVSHRYRKPFFVLLSCILSLRTKDQTTFPASERLFRLAKTPQQILKLSLRTIEKAIYPVGFYRTKAKTIKGIAADMLQRFGGQVPDTLEELLSLKGVGRKTANLVLTLGFGKLGICVDTHVHRLSNRLGIVKTKTPFDTEMQLRSVLPKKFWILYNDLFVAYGQNVCVPVSPWCSRCQIKRFCPRSGVGRSR